MKPTLLLLTNLHHGSMGESEEEDLFLVDI